MIYFNCPAHSFINHTAIDYLTVGHRAILCVDFKQSLFTASLIGDLLLTLYAVGTLGVGVLVRRRALLLHLELVNWGTVASVVLVICVSVVVH